MASLQKPINPSATDEPQQIPSVLNGKRIKVQGSSDEFTTPVVAESSRQPTTSHRRVSDSDFRPSSPSWEKETERRLSQVVPKREKGKEIVEEERPWEAKNILTFGKHPEPITAIHWLRLTSAI